MIDRTCSNCIKWYDCEIRTIAYSPILGKYLPCEDFECDDRLDGREARCPYCGHREPSAPGLAFFQYRADKEYDSYYCGCYGWD